GEIRTVDRLEQRILEAERLGFMQIYISKFQSKSLDFKTKSIKILHVANIDELYQEVFVP
ncbi:MAG: DNA repair protein RadA, partial [Saprospiraceae bacterium]|nr:DNA repair protein RadA [Saprospiraceae bacterium]